MATLRILNGQIYTLLVRDREAAAWETRCAQCGRPFLLFQKETTLDKWGPSRRCPEHAKKGRRLTRTCVEVVEDR